MLGALQLASVPVAAQVLQVKFHHNQLQDTGPRTLGRAGVSAKRRITIDNGKVLFSRVVFRWSVFPFLMRG